MSPSRKKTPDGEYPEYPNSLPRPEVVREGDSWTCRWPQDCGPECCAVMQFENPKESSDGLHVELTVWFRQRPDERINGDTPYFTKGLRLNLSSSQARESAVKRLKGRKEVALWRDGNSYSLRWPDMIEQTFPMVIDGFREGNATLDVVKQVNEEPEVLYMVERLLPLNQTSTIYCDGGLGKSWLVLFIGILIALGIDHPPFKLGRQFKAKRTPILVLDWEVEEGECRRRVGWLVRGLCLIYGWNEEEITARLDAMLWYRRMERPIHQELNRIRRDIARYGIGLVIIDSIVPASGGNPNDADVAAAAMNAIRNLYPATRLIVAHISKADAKANNGGGGESGVYGNAFYKNLGRSIWEMKVDKQGGSYDGALVHRKVNVGLLQGEFGFSFRWDEEQKAMFISTANVRQNAILSKSLGLEAEIIALLTENRQMTEKALCKETNKSEYRVQKALSNLEVLLQVVKIAGGQGKGNLNTWALKARQEGPDETPAYDQAEIELDEEDTTR